MEARFIDDALKFATRELKECGYEEDDLQDIKDAREILKKLKEITIEEYLGEK